MNFNIRHSILLATVYMMTMLTAYAQESAKIEEAVSEIVTRYETIKGVECMKVVKGRGLEMVKMMFNKEFGKDFMKGVTSITIIEYSDSSPETCQALRGELDVFLSMLEEFTFSDEEKFSGNDYIRCFASASDSTTISDFVIALESEDSKMIMYMAGKIKVE